MRRTTDIGGMGGGTYIATLEHGKSTEFDLGMHDLPGLRITVTPTDEGMRVVIEGEDFENDLPPVMERLIDWSDLMIRADGGPSEGARA